MLQVMQRRKHQSPAVSVEHQLYQGPHYAIGQKIELSHQDELT
uniref:Uncharacterized protein n=1 Tax=Arundo donax TaxID=35708 RepID=A0A0A9BIF8_ARUDO